jgi:protein TonB
MERDTKKDVMLAGFLALLIHAALVPLQFSGFRGSNLTGRQESRIAVDLVARRPAAEVLPQSKGPKVSKKRTAKKVIPKVRREVKPPDQPKAKVSLPEKKDDLRQQAVSVQKTTEKDSDVKPTTQAEVPTSQLSTKASPSPPDTSKTATMSSSAASEKASATKQASLGVGESSGSSRSFVEAQSPRYGYRREPRYPRVAVRRGYEGTVLLKVRVLDSGRVDEVAIEESSGYRILDKAALEAVKTWRFTPARRGNKAVMSWALVPITFNLK